GHSTPSVVSTPSIGCSGTATRSAAWLTAVHGPTTPTTNGTRKSGRKRRMSFLLGILARPTGLHRVRTCELHPWFRAIEEKVLLLILVQPGGARLLPDQAVYTRGLWHRLRG